MAEIAGFLAVNVGNSALTFARFEGDEPHPLRRFLHAEVADAADAIVRASSEHPCDGVVVASVHTTMRDALLEALIPKLDVDLYRIGDDLPIPINHALSDVSIARTGQDRLLNALAAHRLLGAAAMIVDAGTAITVDFVDGEGTFHGGAIAPGARMSLRALHAFAPALPEIDLHAPADAPFGVDTEQAILQGMLYGAQGLVHRLLERYAEAAGFYPPVLATGGDAALLFDGDPIVERIVPDLTLRGIAYACRSALANDVDA